MKTCKFPGCITIKRPDNKNRACCDAHQKVWLRMYEEKIDAIDAEIRLRTKYILEAKRLKVHLREITNLKKKRLLTQQEFKSA